METGKGGERAVERARNTVEVRDAQTLATAVVEEVADPTFEPAWDSRKAMLEEHQ